MPAVSKAQQRFMGMVHATQKGDMETPSKDVKTVAKSISKKDAKDFASTPHKGLPDNIKEMILSELRSIGVIQKEYFSVIDDIKKTLSAYKDNKGTDKEKQIVSKLKLLNDKKKKLSDEMDGKVSSMYKDAELQVDEASTTASVDGYATPYAFGKGEDEKTNGKRQADLTGYSVVKEAFIPNVGNIDDFKLKSLLLNNPKVKEILGNDEWKFLSDDKTDVIMVSGKPFNTITTDGKLEFELDLKAQKLVKPLGKARPKIASYYSNLNEDQSWKRLLDPYNWFKSKDIFQNRFKNTPSSVVQELIKLTKKNGDDVKVVGNNVWGFSDKSGKDNQALWQYSNGYLYYTNPHHKSTYDTIIPKLVNSKNESVNENRWIDIKNEDSPATTKVNKGISNINKQLAEIEKFLGWYGKLKSENGLGNEDLWKRTNSHIYSIKERLLNLERKLRKISE